MLGHDHVHVGLGAGILRIIEIEYRLPVPYADGYCGNHVAQRVLAEQATPARHSQRVRQRYTGTGDRRGTRPAVGLDDIAIDEQGVFAELAQIDRGTQ